MNGTQPKNLDQQLQAASALIERVRESSGGEADFLALPPTDQTANLIISGLKRLIAVQMQSMIADGKRDDVPDLGATIAEMLGVVTGRLLHGLPPDIAQAALTCHVEHVVENMGAIGPSTVTVEVVDLSEKDGAKLH